MLARERETGLEPATPCLEGSAPIALWQSGLAPHSVRLGLRAKRVQLGALQWMSHEAISGRRQDTSVGRKMHQLRLRLGRCRRTPEGDPPALRVEALKSTSVAPHVDESLHGRPGKHHRIECGSRRDHGDHERPAEVREDGEEADHRADIPYPRLEDPCELAEESHEEQDPLLLLLLRPERVAQHQHGQGRRETTQGKVRARSRCDSPSIVKMARTAVPMSVPVIGPRYCAVRREGDS